ANKNPITKAINEGNTVLLDDIRTATTDAPWLRGLCDYGVKSLIAIPLFIGWRPYGVLVVSVGNDNTYHKNDIELLNEFADDLAYGIEALRLRLAHDQAQNALVTAAHQWRTTFDTLSDLLCIVDRNGNITHSNQAAIQFFDKKCEELVNAPICQLLHQETEKPERCAMVEAMTTGLPAVESLEIGDRWYNITIQPIFDEDGNVQGAIHLMSDFTARKLADEKLEQNYRRLQRIMNDTIAAIAKIAEMRDPYTAGHERRVSELACAIGHELQMTPDQLEGLRVAGILHDIGKLYVPAEMLSKSGKLSDVEFGVIRAHTEAGYEILQSIDFPWPIAQMVLQHHERMDGTGYPNGLSGNDILLEARILAVADVVESMASHRPYRPSRGLESALSEIESKSGTAFDPEVVQVCIRLFREQGYTFTK
ncbi:MAG TPA: HD domain-containing phosphohydrolase, partial [Armatimonadota bacterium]|nr:HD domain-containing phosphohydrolase [Armatimonadota bacterium]